MLFRFIRFLVLLAGLLLMFLTTPFRYIRIILNDNPALQASSTPDTPCSISPQPSEAALRSPSTGDPLLILQPSNKSSTAITTPLDLNISQSPYAYVFYATDDIYACSALVIIRRLHNFRTVTTYTYWRHHQYLSSISMSSAR
jgi:hypothetical protein